MACAVAGNYRPSSRRVAAGFYASASSGELMPTRRWSLIVSVREVNNRPRPDWHRQMLFCRALAGAPSLEKVMPPIAPTRCRYCILNCHVFYRSNIEMRASPSARSNHRAYNSRLPEIDRHLLLHRQSSRRPAGALVISNRPFAVNSRLMRSGVVSYSKWARECLANEARRVRLACLPMSCAYFFRSASSAV